MAFLEKFFGPSKSAVWTALAAELNAQYVDGGFWKGDRVEAEHGHWVITLDTYTVSTGKSSTTYTRMRAPYRNPTNFQFRIRSRNFFDGIGDLLGLKDLEVGYPQFDHDFVIKANDLSSVKQLLADPTIRELIAGQPAISFSVADDDGFWKQRFPDGTDELYFSVLGVIKDQERLKHLFELFAATLDQLCRIGSATEDDAGVRL